MKVEISGYREFSSAAELRAHYAKLKAKSTPVKEITTFRIPDKPKPQSTPMKLILKALTSCSQISEHDILTSPTRRPTYWRMIGMYIAREEGKTLNVISRFFVLKNHTTPFRNHQRISTLLATNTRVRHDVRYVQRIIKHLPEVLNGKRSLPLHNR